MHLTRQQYTALAVAILALAAIVLVTVFRNGTSW
jgi:hypothetical protein